MQPISLPNYLNVQNATKGAKSKMGELKLFSDGKENRAFDLLFKEKKSAQETSEILEKENFEMSVPEILKFKKNAFEILKENDRAEKLNEYFLESIDRIKIEFEDIVDETKSVMQLAKASGDSKTQLEAIKELRSQMQMALGKMVDMEKRLTQYNQGTTINASNVFLLLKGVQEQWFDEMQAELLDGKLIFNSPKPEVLDSFNSWQFRKNAGAYSAEPTKSI